MTNRARRMASLGLALMVGGCALIGGRDTDDQRDAWLEYLGGNDLRAACDVGALDRVRLITRKPKSGDFQTLDIIGTVAGGAVLVLRTLRDEDFANRHPLGGWRNEGERQLLTPPEASALISRLDREGLFTPPPDVPAPPTGDFSWLVSGCLNGIWFLNLSITPSEGEDADITTGWRR